MNGDVLGWGVFLVSFNFGWYGGIYLIVLKVGNVYEFVWVIVDGIIVFVCLLMKGLFNLLFEYFFMYNGVISDGVVVIRYEVEIGEGE